MFLSECAHLIEGRIGGEATDAIILCGSFAAGDESVVLEEDPPVLLSDVDLVAVVKSFETLVEWSRRKAELGTACENLLPGVRFSGRVDVGVMLAGDLATMSARPGVYDMRTRGSVLTGNAAILERIPAYKASDITAREAVVLIENRIVSLLDARPGGRRHGEAEAYGFLYRIARAYTDIAAAALSIGGAYVTGYAARRDLLRAKTGAEPGGLLGKLVGEDLLGRIELWTRFKLEPSLEIAGIAGNARSLDRLWEEAGRDVLMFWRKAATHLVEPNRNISTPRGMEELMSRAGNWGEWRNHLRSWRAILSELPVSRRVALALSLGGGIISGYPLDVVRHEGIRLLDHRLVNGPEAPVRGAKGGFPHRGGPWNSAAGELCGIWTRLVFGRTD